MALNDADYIKYYYHIHCHIIYNHIVSYIVLYYIIYACFECLSQDRQNLSLCVLFSQRANAIRDKVLSAEDFRDCLEAFLRSLSKKETPSI